MPSFYNGKRFFLTYPRCDRLPHELAAFLSERADVNYYLVAREKHEDGGLHLHACVEFATIQRHDHRWLDFDGHHPNKQDPRKWDACRTYCKKGGDFIEGPEEHHVRAALNGLEKNKVPPNLSELVRNYSSQAEWFDFCAYHGVPFGYAQFHWNNAGPDVFTILEDTEVKGEMCAALRSCAYDPGTGRTKILLGPSGCGKTTWAKINCPKPALFCTHIDDLKKFRNGFHKCIIFDDVDFKHYPRTAQIHIVDFENPRSIHVRYGTVQIPAGIYKIFTCNEHPLDVNDPAIRRRITIATVR